MGSSEGVGARVGVGRGWMKACEANERIDRLTDEPAVFEPWGETLGRTMNGCILNLPVPSISMPFRSPRRSICKG
jgi:hypothetical protein